MNWIITNNGTLINLETVSIIAKTVDKKEVVSITLLFSKLDDSYDDIFDTAEARDAAFAEYVKLLT